MSNHYAHAKDTKKSLKQANEFRKTIGLPIIVPTIKECMRCGKEFLSYGKNNRLCGCVNREEDIV